MTERRATNEELGREAAQWNNGELTPSGWEDAPEAVPRVKESVPISLRLPKVMHELLKEFGRREGVGYQVLIKRWLDDRIREERSKRAANCPERAAANSVPTPADPVARSSD